MANGNDENKDAGVWLVFKCPACGGTEWAECNLCEVSSPCDGIKKCGDSNSASYDITYSGYSETHYETASNKRYYCSNCLKEWTTVADMARDGAFVEAKSN